MNNLLVQSRGENDELKLKFKDYTELSRKNMEYEGIIRQLRVDVERLGDSNRKAGELEIKITQFSLELQKKNDEINKLSRENQELGTRIYELGEANRKVSEY